MVENFKRIWTEDFLINWHEADAYGSPKLSSICNYLQESAWRHAKHMGFGYEEVEKRNELWVIIGLMVRMLKYPSWGETITVETWPKGIDRLVAFRDFRILDKAGDVLGAATSSWMILDIDSRRPKPVDVVKDVLHLATKQDVLNENPPHLSPQKDSETIYTHKIQYSEVDFHSHVNNTRYIDWFTDAYPESWHREMLARTFIINFLAEARSGESIDLVAEQNGQLHGIRQADKKVIFRASAEWVSR